MRVNIVKKNNQKNEFYPVAADFVRVVYSCKFSALSL